jgi:hypothetical protein
MVSETDVLKASEPGAMVMASVGESSHGVMSNHANRSSGVLD